MLTYKFDAAWVSNQWMSPCYISIDHQGIIKQINSQPNHGDINITQQQGALIPGFINAHSHAFQYAMAGCAELIHSHTQDFWGWRDTMYRLANQLNPTDIEAIATQLFSNLLAYGYTQVVEFLYIHKDKSGLWYNEKTEIGDAIARAAKKIGIKLTLIPVYYQKGGFNQKIRPEQKRFYIESVDAYESLISDYENKYAEDPLISIGKGIHSLRAATHVEIKEIINKPSNQQTPFHIHIAEQIKEVEECLHYLNRRPVEWLLENCEINHNFNLVHATHITDHELNGIVQSEANVIICPSTEANLGDGLFPFTSYVNLSGKWTIGTDSHVGLNPFEELRWLDYGTRLTRNLRQSWHTDTTKERGDYLINEAIKNGYYSVGQKHSGIGLNQPLDGIIIDTQKDIFVGRPIEKLQSILCYCGSREHIKASYINGNKIYERDNQKISKNTNDLEKILSDIFTN